MAWQSQLHGGPGMAQRQFQRQLTPSMASHDFDVLIVGSGLAGLSAALHLAPTHRVAVITKRTLLDGARGTPRITQTGRASGGERV